MHDTVSGHELRILSCLRLQERRLKIRHMELQYEMHARIPVFCYGCNGIEVVRQRCENPRLESEAASLEGFARVFAGNRVRWNGGVASIIPFEGEMVLGSVIRLTKTELRRLDAFESVDSSCPFSPHGLYRRDWVTVSVSGAKTKSIAYLMNDLTWVRPPSIAYLRSIQRNMHWVTITRG